MKIYKIIKILLIISILFVLIAGAIMVYNERYVDSICQRSSGGSWEYASKYRECVQKNQKKLEKPNYIIKNIEPIFEKMNTVLIIIFFAIYIFTVTNKVAKQKMKDISILSLVNLLLNIFIFFYLSVLS